MTSLTSTRSTNTLKGLADHQEPKKTEDIQTSPDFGSAFEQNDLVIDSLVTTKHHICVHGVDQYALNHIRIYSREGVLLLDVPETTAAELEEQATLGLGFNYADHQRNQDAESRLFRSLLFYPAQGIIMEEIKDFQTKNQSSTNPFPLIVDLELICGEEPVKPLDNFRGEPSGRYILFGPIQGSLGVFDTWDEKGGPAEPKAWRRLSWSAGKTPPEQLDSLVLSHIYNFVSLDSANPDSTELVLRNEPNHLSILRESSPDSYSSVYHEECSCLVRDPLDSSRILYGHAEFARIKEIAVAHQTAKVAVVRDTLLPIEGRVSSMALDPVGTTLACTIVHEAETGSTLLILNRNSMKVTAIKVGVWGPIAIDDSGTILGLDDSGHLCFTPSTEMTRTRYVRTSPPLAKAVKAAQLSSIVIPSQVLQSSLPALPEEHQRAERRISENLLALLSLAPHEVVNESLLNTLRQSMETLHNSASGRTGEEYRAFLEQTLEPKLQLSLIQELISVCRNFKPLFAEIGEHGDFGQLDLLRQRFSALYEGCRELQRCPWSETALRDYRINELIDHLLDELVQASSKAHKQLEQRALDNVKVIDDLLTTRLHSARSVRGIARIMESREFLSLQELREVGVADTASQACIERLHAAARARTESLSQQTLLQQLVSGGFTEQQSFSLASIFTTTYRAARDWLNQPLFPPKSSD